MSNKELLGNRTIRCHRENAPAFYRMGFLIVFLGLTFLTIPDNIAFTIILVIFGILFIVGTRLTFEAAWFFEKAFKQDKNLLHEIEAIGESYFPFSREWQKQLLIANGNKHYGHGFWYETYGYLAWIFAILLYLVYFIHYILNESFFFR